MSALKACVRVALDGITPEQRENLLRANRKDLLRTLEEACDMSDEDEDLRFIGAPSGTPTDNRSNIDRDQ